MKKLLQGCALAGAFVFAVAGAQEKKPATAPAAGGSGAAAKPMDGGKPAMGAPPAEMAPPKPGPETMLLKPMAGTLATTGKVPAGAMGPSSPELASKGSHSCKWTADKLWLQCEIKDTTGSGKQSMTWAGHMMTGWDYSAKMYRTVLTDNMGMAMMLQGKADGPKLQMESVGDYQFMGQPFKMRVTLDMTDPKAIKFTDEREVGKSGKWTTFEESTMKPAGK